MMSWEYRASSDLKSVKIITKSAIFRNKNVTRYYRFIFNECDTNNDGRISVAELKDFLANNEGDVPDEVVKSLHNCFDKDKDHQLSFDEFLELINNPTVTEAFKRIGSRYLKFVAPSSVRRRSLKLQRTVTNTGLYEEQITFNYYTIGMLLLSLLQIICFYVDKEYNEVILNHTQFDPAKKYEIWRFVTYILNHTHAVHLYGNVIVQLILGLPLEMVHSWRVPVIYLVGSVGGCLAQAVMYDTYQLIGGSAGVFSFYSAHIATVIMNWREMSHPVIHLIIFVILIAFGAIGEFIMYAGTNTVSYVSHIGGIVTGLLLGILVLRNIRETRLEKRLWYVSGIILYTLGIIFTMVLIVKDIKRK